MDRNIFQRIEVAFPIEKDAIKRRLITDLDTHLSDNLQAWNLQSNGKYVKVSQDTDEESVSAQIQLLTTLTENL
jgi:polyphosphate kinase